MVGKTETYNQSAVYKLQEIMLTHLKSAKFTEKSKIELF